MRTMPILLDAEPATAAIQLHRGRRAAVLVALKGSGNATAKELAAALRCSLNAVRHHLRELEAEGVVDHQLAAHGVGAPAHSYRLTATGHALFPDRYQQTVADLLDHLVASEGRAAAIALLEAHYRALASRAQAGSVDLPAGRRGELVARLLASEGYMATWAETAAGGALLTEHNCPHQMVAERFPEICDAEEAFLARVLDATIERRSRITSGCGTCSYHVVQSAKDEASQ